MPPFNPEQIKPLKVPGTAIVTLEQHVDDRGLLYEVTHASDNFVQ